MVVRGARFCPWERDLVVVVLVVDRVDDRLGVLALEVVVLEAVVLEAVALEADVDERPLFAVVELRLEERLEDARCAREGARFLEVLPSLEGLSLGKGGGGGGGWRRVGAGRVGA